MISFCLTNFLASMEIKGALFVGQLLNQVLARNLIRDLSSQAIHRLSARDTQKLDGVGQGVCFAY
jgi:hypothetical protein